MLVLSTDNATDYLRAHQFVGPGPVRIELLGGGVSNVVLRVVAPERTFVLKQSCPQLRTRDAWFSDLDRIYREQEVMEALFPVLPTATVPEILFVDRENYSFAMSHAPAPAQVWKEALLAGEIDPALGEQVGVVLGNIHQSTAHRPDLATRFGDRAVYVQLRVDPFYRRVQERRPEVRDLVEPVIQRMLTAHEALCHGDYTPKNILTHDRGFTLVDYETAHIGDPTMDLGLLLAHLLLKAARRPEQRAAFFDLTRAVWRGYGAVVRYRPLAEIHADGVEHLGVCLLARIDGTSPVDYLNGDKVRDEVRRAGRRLLQERPTTWEMVLSLLEQEWGRP
jgi:5-methylthioribose kinase